MTYGEIVAKRYKKQYCKRKDWTEMDDWEIKPKQVHLILLELKSKEAIDALLGNDSWTRRLPRKLSAKRRGG